MDMKQIERDINKLRGWEDAYYNGQQKISDAMYDVEKDRVVALLKKHKPDHPYLDEVGAPVPSGSQWPKFTHTSVMGSLGKCNDKEGFVKWGDRVKLGRGKNLFLSEKADGWTLAAYYTNGKLDTLATRGDGAVGEDVTANARYFKNVLLTLPGDFTGIIRGEGLIFLDDFKKHFADMSNPRAAAGKIRDTKNPHIKRHVSVRWFDVITDDVTFKTWGDKFRFIENLGLKTITYYENLSLDGVWSIYDKYVAQRRSSLNYWIDGLVARVSDVATHDSLGIVDKRPKGSVAIKFPANGVETVLLNVIFQRGRSGRITPVGLIKPVIIDGTTVARVSLHGPDWIESMGLMTGDVVSVAKAGDIIPQIIDRIKPGKISKKIIFPTQCDRCNAALKRNGAYLECQNKACEGEKIGTLAKWFDKTGIKGIGGSTLESLAQEVNDVADLYEADVRLFARAARGSTKLGKKIYNEIQASRTIDLAIFLSALHIDSLGTTNGQKLANHFKTLDAVLNATEADFRKVDGIANNASKIVAGLKRKRKLIERLDHLLDVQDVTQGGLTGLSFCLTGRLISGKKRSEVEAWIKKQGGIVKGLDKTLSYLVTDTPDSGSSKNTKADKYGVKKITEIELYALLDTPKGPLDFSKGVRGAVRKQNLKPVKRKIKKKITVKRGAGLSLFDAFGGSDAWLELASGKPGKFHIISDNLCEEGDPKNAKTRLGFSAWDDDVTNLDEGISEQSQRFGISCHLKWKNVEIREKLVIAPSFAVAKEALQRVTVTSWSEGDL